MRCPKCGMVFENRSAICPRCGADMGENNAAVALLNRTLFRIAGYPVNFLQLYAVFAVNIVVLCGIFNAALYSGVLWVLPAAAGLAAGYFLLRIFGNAKRKLLIGVRRFSAALILFAVFLQVFVTKDFWATEWFYPATVLCGYAVTAVTSVVAGKKVNQAHITLFAFTVIGIVPFILQLAKYCSGNETAYYFCFAQFIISMLFFLNAILILMFRVKKAIGGILE